MERLVAEEVVVEEEEEGGLEGFTFADECWDEGREEEVELDETVDAEIGKVYADA